MQLFALLFQLGFQSEVALYLLDEFGIYDAVLAAVEAEQYGHYGHHNGQHNCGYNKYGIHKFEISSCE